MSKYPIITLCGSTRFKEQFEEIQKKLTLDGYIVLSVGLFSHSEENSEEWLNNGTKKLLDDIHKEKIKFANAVYIIDVDSYIGFSTKQEIEYAENRGIPVFYYSKGYECNKIALDRLMF